MPSKSTSSKSLSFTSENFKIIRISKRFMISDSTHDDVDHPIDICKKHLLFLRVVCLDESCKSEQRQVCRKCQMEYHYGHTIIDKIKIVQYFLAIRNELYNSMISLQLFERFIKQQTCILPYQQKQLLEKCQDFYSRQEEMIERVLKLRRRIKESLNQFISNFKQVELTIAFLLKYKQMYYYLIILPSLWINKITQAMKQADSQKMLSEGNITLNWLNHFNLKNLPDKKVTPDLQTLPADEKYKLQSLEGDQLAIINSNQVYLLEVENQQFKLLVHTVEHSISAVYSYKNSENLLITCGETGSMMASNRIFNLGRGQLNQVDFVNNQLITQRKLYLRGIRRLFPYDKKTIICVCCAGMVKLLSINSWKVIFHYRVPFKIDNIMSFGVKNEILLFCQEKLIILNIINKSTLFYNGKYDQCGKKKLDESHYAIWNQSLIEIFDIFQSHQIPIFTFNKIAVDLDLVLGKLFLLQNDNSLCIYK